MSSVVAQPLILHPHSVSSQPSTTHSRTFAPFILVLAVIGILAGIACLLGQIFARRYLRPRPRREHVAQYSDYRVEGAVEMSVTHVVDTTHKESKDVEDEADDHHVGQSHVDVM